MTGGRTMSLLVAGALAAGAVVVGLGPAPVAQAGDVIYLVLSTLDEPHDPAFPGQCVSTPSGACTLRAALGAGPIAPVGSDDQVTVSLANVLGQTISLDGPIAFGDWGGSVRIEASLDPAARVRIVQGSIGGLLEYQGAGTLELVGLTLEGGNATADGGGLLVDDADAVQIWNSAFVDNQAAGNGGGASINANSLLVSDSTFDGNSAAGEGGAINFFADGPGGANTFDRVDFTGNSSTGGGALRIVKDAIFPTIIVSSRFEANHATIGSGGAVACSGCDGDGSGVFLRESSVVGNTGSAVGGVTSTYVSATNTTFTGNLGESGSAISAANGQLVHVTMAENDTVSPGLAVDPGGEITTRSSILLDACSGTVTSPFGDVSLADSDICVVGGNTATPAGPIVFAPLDGAGGPLTGDRRELPVLIPPFSSGAPCAALIDERGALRPTPSPANPCTFGAVEPEAGGEDRTLLVDQAGFDAEDRYPGDGVCDTWRGGCTLRAAVMETQALPSQDIIQIADGLGAIRLTLPFCNPASDLNGRCADLDISRGNVSIFGAAGKSTIGATSSRVFDLSTDVTLSDLDLEEGHAAGEFGGGGLVEAAPPAGKAVWIFDSELHGGQATGQAGGAVSFVGEGTLVLQSVDMHDNVLINGVGGALNVTSTAGDVRLINVRATDNSAQFRSAFVIETGGSVRLTDVVVADNLGSFAVECRCADATFERVSIHGNTGLFTGGLFFPAIPDSWTATPPGIRLSNVNISANRGRGAAMRVDAALAGQRQVPVSISYTTVARNDGRNGSGFVGGGFVNNNPDPATRPTVSNSIFADNLADTPATANCIGPITALSAVFDPLNGCAAAGVDTRDPLLGQPTERAGRVGPTGLDPLGTVPVVEPAPSSPVVNAVECSETTPVDVSNVPRPTGAGCDAGAVEVLGIALHLFPSLSSVTASGSAVPLSKLRPTAVAPRIVPGTTLAAPTVDGQELRALDLRDTPLGSIPLGSIPLGSIPLGSIPLGSIPLGSIPLNRAGGWTEVLDGTTLANRPLQNVTFAEVLALDPPVLGTDESAIKLADLDLRSTPLGSIPLGSIALANLPLGSIPLGSIGLDWCANVVRPNVDATVTCGPGGDIDPTNPATTLLALSLFGVPLGSIPLGSIPLGSIDLSASPLGSIPLGSIALDASPLGSIPLGSIPLGSIPLGSIPLGSIPLGSIPLGSIPLGSIPLGSIPLGSIPLGSIPLGSIPLGSIPLGSIPLGSIPLGSIPLGSIPLGSIPLGSIPLGSIPLGSIPLGSIPLGSIPLGSIPLGSIPLGSIPLGSIPLGSIPLVANCQVVNCNNASLTLAQVAATPNGLVPGARLQDVGAYGRTTLEDLAGVAAFDALTLASLGSYGQTLLSDLAGVPAFDALTLAGLGAYGDTTLADLGGLAAVQQLTLAQLQAGTLGDLEGWDGLDDLTTTIAQFLALLPSEVRSGLTLGSLLQGVVPAEDYPWEDLDLTAAGDVIAEASGGLVTFVLEIDATAAAEAAYDVDIQLPTGFRYVEGSLTYPGAINATTVEGSVVSTSVSPRSGVSLLQLQARAPLAVGFSGRSSATLTTVVDGGPLVVTATGVEQVVSEAFEPNDTPATATPVSPGTLYLTHIASTGDEDWFAVEVAAGERLSAIVSNLAADLDLAVFAPATPRLREASEGAVVPAADQGRSLLAGGTVADTQVAGDIDVSPPAGYELLGVSANRGTSDEDVASDGLDAGRYLIRVTGYQGATSAQPYALRVKLTAPSLLGACLPSTLPVSQGPAAGFTATVPSGATTLYVIDSGRMVAHDPAGGTVIAALERLLDAVADDPDAYAGEVAGVLDVATVANVQSAYTAWDRDPCTPARANGVVSAIGAEIDDVLFQHQTITHVVLVGGDEQIPFARVRDATIYSNEREYVEGPGVVQTPLTTSLALGYLMSDDPYGDAAPLTVGTRELFVPDVALGRLVETPPEIVVALDNYRTFFGELDPSTALSTGYDFLQDGASAVAGALSANGLPTARLIDDEWDAGALDAALSGTATVPAPDVASVNAHFDHFRALPAEPTLPNEPPPALYTTDDVLDATTRPAIERALLFSMGCHGGLSVSDLTVGGIRSTDWAQTFTGAGGVFAGNTGFGYGDDAVVGATEDLMLRFARHLDGTRTVGEAMALAKQLYVAANRENLTPFDEKVVAQVVVYGLPQYRLGDGTPAEQTEVTPVPDVLGPLDGTVGTLANAFELLPNPADVPNPERGRYYAVAGDTQTTANQPVQPRAIVDVTATDRRARGALITSLASHDVPLADPVYFTPAVDSGATAPEVSTTPTIFPTQLQGVSRYDDTSGPRDQLVVVPGQFFGSARRDRGWHPAAVRLGRVHRAVRPTSWRGRCRRRRGAAHRPGRRRPRRPRDDHVPRRDQRRRWRGPRCDGAVHERPRAGGVDARSAGPPGRRQLDRHGVCRRRHRGRLLRAGCRPRRQRRRLHQQGRIPPLGGGRPADDRRERRARRGVRLVHRPRPDDRRPLLARYDRRRDRERAAGQPGPALRAGRRVRGRRLDAGRSDDHHGGARRRNGARVDGVGHAGRAAVARAGGGRAGGSRRGHRGRLDPLHDDRRPGDAGDHGGRHRRGRHGRRIRHHDGDRQGHRPSRPPERAGVDRGRGRRTARRLTTRGVVWQRARGLAAQRRGPVLHRAGPGVWPRGRLAGPVRAAHRRPGRHRSGQRVHRQSPHLQPGRRLHPGRSVRRGEGRQAAAGGDPGVPAARRAGDPQCRGHDRHRVPGRRQRRRQLPAGGLVDVDDRPQDGDRHRHGRRRERHDGHGRLHRHPPVERLPAADPRPAVHQPGRDGLDLPGALLDLRRQPPHRPGPAAGDPDRVPALAPGHRPADGTAGRAHRRHQAVRAAGGSARLPLRLEDAVGGGAVPADGHAG